MIVRKIKSVGIALGTFALLLIGANASASELKDIQFSELPGEKVELKLEFDSLPSEPTGYTIEQPARIVLDFADVDNSLPSKKFPINIGDISGAVVVSGGGRTRLIVNMQNLMPYATRTEGNTFFVEVGTDSGASTIAAAPTSTPSVQATPMAQKTNRFDKSKSEIGNIDFRRGQAGEGKVIIALSNPNISIDIEEVAKGIEVSFMQTALPSNLARKLDVTDFATPVEMISAASDNIRAAITIEASGEYDYLAYQADNEYVISVKPLTKAEIEEKREKFAFTGEKLSLNFQSIEVRNVLQLIADVTELNLVTSDTVQGSITLRLDNVPWDQALDIVLKTKGLDKRMLGNVLMVAPAEEIAERERRELQTKKQLEELAPLRTEYIRIRYANAQELFELFIPQQGGGGRQGQGGAGLATGSQGRNQGGQGSDSLNSGILSERGQAIVDERTNSIILTDTEEKISEFKKIIDQIDIPIRQVMIEARIVIANSNFREEFGAALGNVGAFNSNGNRTLNVLTGDIQNSDTLTVGADGSVLVESTPFFDLGVVGGGQFSWSILSDNMFLSLELSALEDAGFAEIVSQPKVITGDKQQATIESGEEIPYRDAATLGISTIQFKEALLKLDVTPQITPDDNVIMDLVITQDTIGRDTASGPAIDVTKLETQVLVPDGQTVVLGGIFQTTSVKQETKIPLLGDIPIVGRAFKKDVSNETKRELLVFITPKIMSNGVTD